MLSSKKGAAAAGAAPQEEDFDELLSNLDALEERSAASRQALIDDKEKWGSLFFFGGGFCGKRQGGLWEVFGKVGSFRKFGGDFCKNIAKRGSFCIKGWFVEDGSYLFHLTCGVLTGSSDLKAGFRRVEFLLVFCRSALVQEEISQRGLRQLQTALDQGAAGQRTKKESKEQN